MSNLLKFSLPLFLNLLYFSAHCQLTTFLDFEGEDFDYTTVGLVSTNDSLYVLNSGNGIDTVGVLFALNKEGTEYDIIKVFNGAISSPSSLVGNDSVLYGSTRSSENNGGAIFKYTIAIGDFEIIKDFSPSEAQEIEIVHITDSLLWCLSSTSFEDEGSIFTVGLDGSDFNKIYNNTSFDLGQNPVDIQIVGDQIYIAFYNGGGIPYPDGTGGTVSSGSIIRINKDGSGYTTIFQGQDEQGTQPRSFIMSGDHIYGLFDSRGSLSGGSLCRFDLDGTNFEILGNINRRGRGDLIQFGDYIFGISADSFFEYNVLTDELSSIFDFSEQSTFDAVRGPIFFNNDFVFATQQGGPDNGGTLVKYNFIPEIMTPLEDTLRNEGFTELVIDIENVFVDKDMDELSFTSTSSQTEVASVTISNNSLTIGELGTGISDITLTVEDQNGGISSETFSLRINAIPKLLNTNNIELEVGTELSVDLDTLFQDSDADDLSFEVSSSDESIATVSINSNILSITGESIGSVQLTVSVDDGTGGTLIEDIPITVTEEVLTIGNIYQGTINVYPNPVSNTLSLFLGEMLQKEVNIKVIDLQGIEHTTKATRENENVLRVDLDNLKTGVYTIIVSTEGHSISGKLFKE